jgi:hypothetical protein
MNSRTADRRRAPSAGSPGPGTSSGLTRVTISPSSPSASRLVARIPTPGHLRNTDSANAIALAIQVSTLSRTRSNWRSCK